MVDRPLVTIITVVWNDRIGLEATIQSIRPIKDDRIEYIVIDGGSTDGTLDVIKEHQSLFDRWISEPDKGIYHAMNKGASLASGEWIWFMNAGDLVHDSEVISRLCQLLNNPNVDVILGGAKTILRDAYQVREGYKAPSDLKDIWKEMPACHQSVLVRSELQKKYGFDLSYKWCADFDLIQRLYQAKTRFCSTDSPLCIYDCVPGESRHWSIYTHERWRASEGSVSKLSRDVYFGWEYFKNLVVRPVARAWRSFAPPAVILFVRRIRGTG